MFNVELFDGAYAAEVDVDLDGNLVIGKVYTEPPEDGGGSEEYTVEEVATIEGVTAASIVEKIHDDVADQCAAEGERRAEEARGW